MFRVAVPFFGLSLGAFVSLDAQEDERLYEFTSKAGKKVIAELLTISEEQRMARIRRQDGIEFDLEIISLSLDDQQYVKDWMERRSESVGSTPPAPGSGDFRLEIEADKKMVDSDRDRDSSYTYESKKYQYTVRVRNISRQPLAGAKVQYQIVWKEALDLARGFRGRLGVDYSRRGRGESGRARGEKEIETLLFNREAELLTEKFSLDSMSYSREVYREDKLMGIIVRVIASDGAIIAEERLGMNRIEDVPWLAPRKEFSPEND